jgi:elongation factor G
MLPAEAAVLLINAQSGIESVTTTVWNFAADLNLPRILVINHSDNPKSSSPADRAQLVEALRDRFGRHVIPVQLPILDDKGFHGVVDLVTMEAFSYTPSSDGSGIRGPIPSDLEAEAKAAHEALVELVAGEKDELMEEFFALGTLPQEHLIQAIHDAIREDRIFPILYTSALGNVATDHLLDFLKIYVPSPQERPPIAARGPAPAAKSNGNGSAAAPSTDTDPATVLCPVADNQPATLYVYKTLVDPFAGRISFFKVIRGCIRNEASLENYARSETERLTHIGIMQGKKLVEVPELHAGDLGVVAKLRVTQTGDTLGARGHDVRIDPHRSAPHPRARHDLRHRA